MKRLTHPVYFRSKLRGTNPVEIRNYVGDSSTNKGIMKTSMEEPDHLFFFNNGISAVATNVRPDNGKGALYCERFSIINGAQTIRSLAKAYPKSPVRVSQVEVLIRISEVSYQHKGDEPDFLANITRYNNTQNSIKLSDFRSNDPIQRALNRRFSKLHKGGKSFWYKNKRTGTRDQTKIAIGMEDFARTIFAFRFGPVDMYGGTSFLFDTAADGGYSWIFGDGKEIWTMVSDDEFDMLAGTWFLCEQVRAEWKSVKEKREAREQLLIADGSLKIPIAKSALERRWMIFYTVGELLRRRYQDAAWSLEFDLSRLGNLKWINGQKSVKDAIQAHTTYACEVLTKVYRSASRNPEFMHRNWFRTKDTLKEITTEIVMSETALHGLPSLFPEHKNLEGHNV